MISDKNRELEEPFPKQLPFGTSEETIQAFGQVTKAAMNSLMVINVCAQVVLKFLLDRLIVMMLELQ